MNLSSHWSCLDIILWNFWNNRISWLAVKRPPVYAFPCTRHLSDYNLIFLSSHTVRGDCLVFDSDVHLTKI
jgi:hypothetical protein